MDLSDDTGLSLFFLSREKLRTYYETVNLI
jgi:hypothetical protein